MTITKLQAQAKTINEQSELLSNEIKTAIKEQFAVIEATDPDATIGNQGQNSQLTNTISDYLGFRGVLTNMFFRNPIIPLYLEELIHDFIIPAKTFTNAQLEPGNFPVDSALNTVKASFGYGKFWKKDGILKEKLRAWYNLQKLNGGTLENEGGVANPVVQLVLNIANQINRELEIALYSGVPNNTTKRGIVGLKTQFTKFNTTATVNGDSANKNSTDPYAVTISSNKIADNSYNKCIYENSVDGYDTFTKDVIARMNYGQMHLGVDHYTLFVPAGSGNAVKRAMQSAENALGTSQVINVSVNGSGATNGDKLSLLSDNGLMYVNNRLDIVELIGGTDQEIMLYPDTINGTYQMDVYEFVTAGTQPRGMRVIAGKMDTQVAELINTANYNFEEAFLTGTNSAERMEISVQWTGQAVASGVALATLYTQCQFAKLLTGDFAPDANVTLNAINMW